MIINFMLPGMYEHHEILFKLLEIKEKNPEYFIDNVNINAVYGNFQFCIWDGGRIFQEYKHATREEVIKIKDIYNKRFNIPIRLIFTSTEIKEKHLYDRFCNMVLFECQNDMNEIVVNSPILEKYIRENYPKYKIISSTTKCLSNPKDFKQEIMNSDYYLVCLDYNLNKNIKLLEELNEEERAKCEFLVNAICPPGCIHRKEHYRLNSLFYLNYGKSYHTRGCGIKGSNLFPSQEHLKNNLTPKECVEYAKKGFNHFKLEGRTFGTATLACNIVKYLVKPEYQLYMIDNLLRGLE